MPHQRKRKPTFLTPASTALAVLALFSVISAVSAPLAVAEGLALSGAPTAGELLMLPPYCKAKLDPKHPNQEYWSRVLGRMYGSIHHYCEGLTNMNRYYTGAPGYSRQAWLSNAINQFDYMLGNYPAGSRLAAGSPLLPEIYLKRAIARGLLIPPNVNGAISDFYKAIELRPRMARTYISLADFYDNMHSKKQALDAIERGLQVLPNNKALQHRYQQLTAAPASPESPTPTDQK